MKLTPKQVEWLNKEQEIVQRIIESEPERGLWNYIMQQQMLGIIARLHNITVKEEIAPK